MPLSPAVIGIIVVVILIGVGLIAFLVLTSKPQAETAVPTFTATPTPRATTAPGTATTAPGTATTASTTAPGTTTPGTATTTAPAATTTAPTTAPARLPENYFAVNSGTCDDGTPGPVLSDGSAFTSTSQSFGTTYCNGVPNSKFFYQVNNSDCPAGSVKMGWVQDTSIDPLPNTQTFGLTVCRAPLGYTVPNSQRISLQTNNVACPAPQTKIGWIRNDKLWRGAGVVGGKNDSFGITVCRQT